MIRLIDVTGGPAIRGAAYGRAARAEIERAIDTYRRFFAIKGLPWDGALATAAEFRPFIEEFDADCAIEIEAIAHGAGRDRNEILLLNARTELLYWHGQKTGAPANGAGADECTGLVARGAATADGAVIHAQNWDWMPEVAEHTVALRIRDHEGPNALHFVEAGQLARHGLNEAGLAVSAMGLHSSRDYGKLGVPSPILRRRMIHAPSMGDAIALLHADGTSFSHAIALSHAAGEAFCFETVPGDVFPLEPQDDVLVHANHFKSDRALASVRDVNLVRCADSLHRDQRLRRLIAARRGSLTPDDVVAALADKAHAPNALCRSPALRQGGLASATVYTLVMLPAEGRARVALSPWREGGVFDDLTIG